MTDQNLPTQSTLEVSLISLLDRTLMIPTSAIVEVVPISMPQVVAKMPRWFLGFLPWQGLRIPFISFEAACGAPFRIHAESNIVVLKTASAALHNNFFALLIQNTPASCTINRDSLLDVVGELTAFESANIRLDNIIATIPNMIAIEQLMINSKVLM